MSGVWCLVSGVWWLVAGVWCLVSGGWWLVAGGWWRVNVRADDALFHAKPSHLVRRQRADHANRTANKAQPAFEVYTVVDRALVVGVVVVVVVGWWSRSWSWCRGRVSWS